MHDMTKHIITLAALVLMCGCFKDKDELTLRADGSGTVRIETRTSLPPEILSQIDLWMERGSAPAPYPPLSETAAKFLFPRKDFEVSTTEEKNGEETVITVEASFKNINALLASPYARAHQLSLELRDGQLLLKAVPGIEAAARVAELKDDDGEMSMLLGGIPDSAKKKDEMRVEFRVTMPAEVAAGNGLREGKGMVWQAARKDFTNAADFAAAAGVVCEARCPASDLTFTPATPPRLMLGNFAQLGTGSIQPGIAVDTNKVFAAARFVPVALRVTRSLDLSGDGGYNQSGAELSGVVVVPADLRPQRFGQPQLDEAIDSKGTDLKPDPEESRFRMGRNYSSFMENEDEDEDENEDEGGRTGPAEYRHPVTFQFSAPEWNVKEITKVKGSIEMRYFSGAQVIKLTNAIPANWITDMSTLASGGFSFGEDEKELDDPQLRDLNLSVRFESAMTENSMLRLSLEVEGRDAVLTEMQVFDAEGRPWPTLSLDGDSLGMDSEDNRTSHSLVVIGNPKPPLSLAVLASGAGAVVNVPIQLEKVPVDSN